MMLLKQRNQSHNRDAANNASDVNQVNSYSFRTHFHKPSDNINQVTGLKSTIYGLFSETFFVEWKEISTYISITI